MNATELFLKDGRPAGIFFCEKCRNVARNKETADLCCDWHYKCKECGEKVEQIHWTVCRKCEGLARIKKENERFNKADKVTEWSGAVYLEGTGNDGFHASLSDLIDELSDEWEGEWPKYAWTCKNDHFVCADIEDIFSSMEGDAPTDFDFHDLDGIPELKAAIEKFNEENKDVVSWELDYTKAVLLKQEKGDGDEKENQV